MVWNLRAARDIFSMTGLQLNCKNNKFILYIVLLQSAHIHSSSSEQLAVISTGADGVAAVATLKLNMLVKSSP